MKWRTLGLALVAGAVVSFAIYGCKSTETTSAILHNQAGRYDLAIEQAQAALQKDPKDAEAHFQLGVAYSELDSVGLAFEHFKQAAILDQKNTARIELIQNNIQSNFARHYNAALKMDTDLARMREFELSVAADPRVAKGHYQLGRAYARMADSGDPDFNADVYYEKAVKEFDEVLERTNPQDKQYVDALSEAGKTLAKAGRSQDAVTRFQRLVEEDPSSYRVIETIGYDLLDRQDWKGAVVFLDLSATARAKINADDFDLFYNIGVAYFQAGRLPGESQLLLKSVEYYQMALNLSPGEPTTTYNILATYVVAKDWDQASTWGERYVSLNPNDEKGWQLLAKTYIELGERDKARQATNRYEEIMRGGQ